MQFFINGKKVRYNPYNMKKDKKLGFGLEVDVYKIGEEVVKFYKPYCNKVRLSKENIERLKQIDTKRILLPTDSLLDKKHQIRGYKMKYVTDLGVDSFFDLEKDDLKEEIEYIREDINTLSDNGVVINDLLQPSNTVYHNGVYLIDPGSYRINEISENENIRTYGINIENINMYLIYTVIEEYILIHNKNIRKEQVAHDINLEFLKSGKYDMLDFLANGVKEDKLSEYVSKKSRKS